MEGGTLPWRVQEMVEPGVEFNSTYNRPLPTPPHGFFWEQHGHDWKLAKFEDHVISNVTEEVTMTLSKASIIEHIVMPEDTLQGLCLRYGVNATHLRRHNFFSGNNIRGIKFLRIPLDAGALVRVQKHTDDLILQKFRNATNEGKEEANYYLTECNNDLDRAIEAWQRDDLLTRGKAASSHFAVSMEDDEIVVNPVSITRATVKPHKIVTSESIEMRKIPIATQIHDPAAVRLL